MSRTSLVLVIMLFAANGCGKPQVEEPQGQAVSLSQEELDYAARMAREPVARWFAWESKGVELTNKEKRYEEALYCFDEAMKAWPKEDPESPIGHSREPTDTLLQKASLYLLMERPSLAIVYYEKFDSYVPGITFVKEGIRKAHEMLDRKSK